jgi:hypothetical protein
MPARANFSSCANHTTPTPAPTQEGRRCEQCWSCCSPTCRDRANRPNSPRSELDKWAAHLGEGKPRIEGRHQPARNLSNPAIAVNLDACMQRTRCVRACREEQVNDVIGPQLTELARHATHYLQIRPGSDVALLNAMMHVIVCEGLQNDAYIAQHTEGFDALRKRCCSTPPRGCPRSAASIRRPPARRCASTPRPRVRSSSGGWGSHGTSTAPTIPPASSPWR